MRVIPLISLLIVLSSSPAIAAPYNTNVLIERGIDPHILNLAVTTFRQQIAYKMAVKYKNNIDGQISEQDFNILYDPFASYGIDLRVQVLKEDMGKFDEGDIKKKLDKIMGLQSYLLTDKLYDENSLQIESAKDNTTIISFKFNSDAIPREIKFYKNLIGRVHIKNNIMEKVVLTSKARFEHNGTEIKRFEKILHFTRIPMNGGYLLKKSEVLMAGEKDGKSIVSNASGVITEYWNEESKAISWRGGAYKHKPIKEADKYHTIYVDLDRTFPLLGQSARKAGYDLPKPFGISAITMLQQTSLHMTSFEFNGSQISPELIGGANSKYESQALAVLVRADLWVLPFLNIGILAGGTETSTDVTLDVLSGFPALSGTHTLPPLSTSSVLYGIGGTVAGGVGNFFATVDMQYITAYTEAADVEIEMTIATPIVGYNFQSVGVRLLLGAQYQDMKEEITAVVDLDDDGNDDTVRVGLKSEKWATLIGIEKGFNRHWNGSLMYSNGDDRRSFNMMIGYRF